MTPQEAMQLKRGMIVVWMTGMYGGGWKFNRAPVHKVVPYREKDGSISVSVQVRLGKHHFCGLRHDDIRKMGGTSNANRKPSAKRR